MAQSISDLAVEYAIVQDRATWGEGREMAINQVNEFAQPNEIVGILVENTNLVCRVWVKLRNERPGLEFEVSPEHLHDTLAMIKEQFGGQSRVVMLWHSHYDSKTPSKRDIQYFPSWLCKLGVVYNAIHDSYQLYNEHGVAYLPWEHGDQLSV